MPAMRGDSVDDPGLAQGTLQTGSAVRTTGKIARRRRPSLRARSAKGGWRKACQPRRRPQRASTADRHRYIRLINPRKREGGNGQLEG